MRTARFIIAIMLLTLSGCSLRTDDPGPEPPGRSGRLVFEDDFERQELGERWLDTGGGYRIEDGRLRAQGAHNSPLWLKRKLPRDVRVELSAVSRSPAVDIKVELFGDGTSKAVRASYTATSYVFILGGWNNSRSIIARMDEHANDRVVRRSPRGEPERTYRFAITRKDNAVEWRVDGKPFLEMNDPAPLAGPGHEHFAFNNWESVVFFDDLRIFEL
jgi:hypothetical protein